MPAERWLPVADTDGLYSVSDGGRVRRELSGHVLKPFPARGGLYVSLSVGGKVRTVQVASLVAAAFLGPPTWGVRRLAYRDGDRKNVRADNLRWVLAHTDHHSGHDLSCLTDGELTSLVRALGEESARRKKPPAPKPKGQTS